MTIDKQKLKALADRVLNERRFCVDEHHRDLAEGVQALMAEVVFLLESRAEARADRNNIGDRYDAAIIERDKLKAENEALRTLVLSALEEGKGRPGTGGNAPGHCHAVPGVWDRGNGDRSGTTCGWCRIWNAAQAMAKEASHG